MPLAAALSVTPTTFTAGSLAVRPIYMLAGDTVHVIAVRGAGEELATLSEIELPP